MGFLHQENTIYAVKVDEFSTSVTYVGLAEIGSLSSSANWQIKRITETGTVTSIEFADGDNLFNNIWDNRTSITYS